MVLFKNKIKGKVFFMKEWVFNEIDKANASQLAQECGIDAFTAYLLCSKGVNDPFLVDEFLSDDCILQDPFCFADMEKAVDRVNLAIENGEKIAVFGDYDCDGVTSTTLLYSVLKELGADCCWRVPSRDEGYGMSETAVEELKQKGVKLIITVDNGVSAFDAIDYANSQNIDVVVTDHHLPSDTLPNAVAVVDPKRADCPSEFKDYAGVGVAFMLCCAICGESPEELLKVYGDLVTVGTIADVMPLVSDNRSIVKEGLNCIKRAKRVGLNALIEASGVTLQKINSSNVAFAIAPRINATGRVFHPEKAIELLLCEDVTRSSELADVLCGFNAKRRELETEILNQALDKLQNDDKSLSAPVIVVGGENWHHGVIGIVAAKLCSIFSRPAVVFSLDETQAVGSARSYEGASIHEILSTVSEFAESFGGHTSAAGITIKRENFEKVKSKIQINAKRLYGEMPFDKLKIACKLNPNSVDINSAYAQRQLEPFGEGNEKPNFAFLNMSIVNIIPLSNGKHLKLVLSRSGGFDKTIEVMYFNKTPQEFEFKKGDKIDVVVTIDINVFNGVENLSMILKDIRKFGFDQQQVLKDIRVYQNFKHFGECEKNIVITRDDIASVYKTIKLFPSICADVSTLLHIFKSDDMFKILVILEILFELNFVKLGFDGKYIIDLVENAGHRDLIESKLFNYFS